MRIDDRDVLQNAETLFLLREAPANDNYIWRIILSLILLGLVNEFVAPGRDILAFINYTSQALTVFNDVMNNVGSFHASANGIDSVALKGFTKF